MTITPTTISGVFVIERPQHVDARGFLSRLFSAETIRKADWLKPVAQVNHTFTAKAGSVRGLHFQHPPHAEMKLVSCLEGEVYDVAVDLRRDSPTFLQWHAEHLSAINRRQLVIPEGCAHGFQTLTDDCVLVYCHSAAYVPTAEGGLRYDDPAVRISWPLAVTNLSDRDAAHPLLTKSFTGITV